MLRAVFLLVLSCCCYACSEKSSTGNTPDTTAGNWQLVWQDEFDADTLDAGRWNYEIGGHGWGNNESQYYTSRSSNSYLQDGNLVIEARKEYYEGSAYTSARLTTRGKGDWRYGKIEVRAQLPQGQGMWPAIWMMPTDNAYGGWAASGELDIMELLGHEPNKVYGTLHYGGSYPNNVHTGTSYVLPGGQDFASGFHTFMIHWQEGKIEWYVDDVLYQTQTQWYTGDIPFPAPFDKRFYMILNVAVGGNWPGYPDGSTVFPQKMLVDYVRVYQKANQE